MIYYIYDHSRDWVKIGYTTPRNLRNRFYNLKSGSGGLLSLVGAHSGNKAKEGWIHEHLKLHKVSASNNGEWYYADEPVLQYIEQNNDFEYFFDVFENDILNRKFYNIFFARFTEAYKYERAIYGINQNLSVINFFNNATDIYRSLRDFLNCVIIYKIEDDNLSSDENNGNDDTSNSVPEQYVWPNSN